VTAFISYSSKNRAVANKIRADLTALGHRIEIDVVDVSPGDSLTARLNSLISHADIAILLISPASLRSKWAAAEWDSLLHRQVEGSIRVIPVIVQPTPQSEIPPLLRSRVAIDIAPNYAVALARLAQQMSRPVEVHFFPSRDHVPVELSLKQLLSRPNQEVTVCTFTGRSIFSFDDDEIAEWIRISASFEMFLVAPEHGDERERRQRIELYKQRFTYQDLNGALERVQNIDGKLQRNSKKKFRPYFVDLSRINFLNVIRAGDTILNRVVGFAQSGPSSPLLVTKSDSEYGQFLLRYLANLRENKEFHIPALITPALKVKRSKQG
jgi:hypothetical protein